MTGRALGIALVAGALLCAGACNKRKPGDRSSGQSGATLPPVIDDGKPPPEVARVRPPSATPHPRIVLDSETLGRVKAAAAAGSPAWRRVEAECKKYFGKTISSGYEGFHWAEAVANLSLCWRGSGDDAYARDAVRYLTALVEDKRTIGDGKGGDEIIRHDSGYPIRSIGVYTALGYDWLHDAPGMTEELRATIRHRLKAWISWYRTDGYLRDNPYSNYFWGYMAAITVAAIATHGELDEADDWLAFATDELLEKTVVPAFRSQLAGGVWAEGWQYGHLVAAEVALVIEAHRTATGADYAEHFPWFGQLVTHHLHTLLPDQKSVYDNATRHQKPPPPEAGALIAATWILDRIDPDRAAHARFMRRELYPAPAKDRVWVWLVSERPDAPAVDPRDPKVLSEHAAGPGLTFARSDWSKAATWVSFQAGPRIAVDHQHNDQGHFELWRGSDGLVLDGGGAFGFATINHNTLLVDDGGDVLNYVPNQGVWARESKTLRFGDDGQSVVAVGDIADAYAPKCVLTGCTKRAVERAIRTLVYVRPNLLVISDDVAVTKPGYGVTWAAHLGVEPARKGDLTSAVVGGSRVDIRTLAPTDGAASVLAEPTTGDEKHVYRANTNHKDRPIWRLEVASKRGAAERRFLHWITADAAGASPPPARAIAGAGLRGATGTAGDQTVTVLFGGGEGGSVEGVPASGKVVVIGLDPQASYAATTSGNCTLAIARGKGHTVGSGGQLTLSLDSCKVK